MPPPPTTETSYLLSTESRIACDNRTAVRIPIVWGKVEIGTYVPHEACPAIAQSDPEASDETHSGSFGFQAAS